MSKNTISISLTIFAIVIIILAITSRLCNGQTAEGYSLFFNNDGTLGTTTSVFKPVESNVDIIMKWNKRSGGTEGQIYDLYKVNSPKEYQVETQTENGLLFQSITVTPYSDSWEYMERANNAQKLIDNPELITPQAVDEVLKLKWGD